MAYILNIIADLITIRTSHSSTIIKYLCIATAIYFIYKIIDKITKYIRWHFIKHERDIQKAFNACGKNLPTLCGEPYAIISRLKWLQEHIFYDLATLNEELLKSSWFGMWQLHFKCMIYDIISEWCASFKCDRKMYNRLDNLRASVKTLKINTVQVRPDLKKDTISSLSEEQRIAINTAITDVLELIYQYKTKYHIRDSRELYN